MEKRSKKRSRSKSRGGKRKKSSMKKSMKRKVSKKSIKSRKSRKGGYTRSKTMAMERKKRVDAKLAEALTGTTKIRCNRNKIVRSGYIKNDGTVVGATCIKDLGAPGKYKPKKGKTKIYLKEGSMGKYGYKNLENKSAEQRRNSIKKAVEAYGYGDTIKKVNVLQVLMKRTDPKIAAIAKSDTDWMKKHKEMLKKL